MRQLLAFLFLFSTVNANALSLCVKGSKANLRSGPGSKYKSTWEVGRYMPLNRVDSQGRWSEVEDVDGQSHWIYTSLLTQKIRCLTIKVAKANLRKGPGAQFPLAEYRAADKYETFKRLDKKGSWYHVENDIGERAWVHESNAWIARTVLSLEY